MTDVFPVSLMPPKCTWWDRMATWGQPLKCSWAGIQEQTQSMVSRSQGAHWWEAEALGGGASLLMAPPWKLPSKIAYLLWQTSQVSWSAAGRKKCSRCFNGEEAGRPAWLQRGARSSFPSFLWQHLWQNIAFSFEHFEQKKKNRTWSRRWKETASLKI